MTLLWLIGECQSHQLRYPHSQCKVCDSDNAPNDHDYDWQLSFSLLPHQSNFRYPHHRYHDQNADIFHLCYQLLKVVDVVAYLKRNSCLDYFSHHRCFIWGWKIGNLEGPLILLYFPQYDLLISSWFDNHSLVHRNACWHRKLNFLVGGLSLFHLTKLIDWHLIGLID